MKKRLTASLFLKIISFRIILTTIFIGLILSTASFAESMKWWDWKSYKVSFQLPTDFKVEQSSKDYFTATKDQMRMEITPWKDSKLTAKDVAKMGYNNLTTTLTGLLVNKQINGSSKHGFKNYVILASGVEQGKIVKVAVAGIINPKSPVNMYVTFKWWDEPNSNSYYNALAATIANSFMVMK